MRARALPSLILAFLISGGMGRAAESYLIVDGQTGHVLASESRNEKRQIASLTKVATAMVVLDWSRVTKADLSQMATVSQEALRAGGVNPVGLQPGDSLSLRDLLYCALIASDNVAATQLAEVVGAQLPNAEGLPPIGNFVAHMNALARTLGMKNTRFLNPSGFDSYQDGALPYSTATDLAKLTLYAYSAAGFPFYVSQTTRTVHVTRAGIDTPVVLTNTNQLLGQDGIDGVKTGRTSKAGDCVILSSEQRPEVRRDGDTVLVTPRHIFVVVLGSADRFSEGSSLVKQGWSLYDQWAAAGRKKGQGL